jgi:alkanesulfonate monooxygenase SsuD/methylene tetrahydromethanopterin reductase-like flavin-dependent oxidoreductase (luciferase family)
VTTLAAVAALSDRLGLQTVVANIAWQHPALLFRQFAQLAVLAGEERVTAGLGAGWSTEEFDAIGLSMPPFRPRMDRLEEVLSLARALFVDGSATVNGTYIRAQDLPLSPQPETRPRILVGGGSDRILRMAGRYADILDLHGDPRHGKVAGATMAQARVGDARRRALTTVEELAVRARLVGAAAIDAGRMPADVAVSTEIIYAAFGDFARVREAERALCGSWAGIPEQRLDRSAYLLFGDPAQMAEALAERQQAYGLSRITIMSESGIALAPADPLRFCREVVPLL